MGAALPVADEMGYATPLDVRATPIASGASAHTVASALSAISASGAATVATAATATNVAMSRLLDELTPFLARPLTVHQRDVLADAMIDLIDARVAAAQLS